MRLRYFLSTVLVASASTAFCATATFTGASSPLAFEHTTQIPGDTLKPGPYSISIVEEIADRMIVRIDSSTNSNHAIFLGVPSTASKIGGSNGAVAWPNGVNKTATLRGFVFSDGKAVEFVYPKEEAAALAKENAASVVAVDPKSEGRVALKSLSHDELNIVNLWLLSLTSTGPDNRTPAVLARHYEAPQAQQPATVASEVNPASSASQRSAATQSGPVAPLQASPAATAKLTTVGPRPTPLLGRTRANLTPESPRAPEVASLGRPSNTPSVTDTARRRPAISQLPHTAGILPGVWLLGLVSIFGFGIVRLRRPSLRQSGS